MGLFDSIRRVVGGSDPTPEPDDDENPELVDLRNADVEQLQEQAEAVADATEDLDFSLASLARLDAAIDRWYDTSVPRADELYVYPIDAVRLGCYLGEVLARVYNGTWSLDPLGVVITGPDGRRTVAVFDVAVQSMTETSVFGGVAALVASEVGFADISRDKSDADTDDETSLSGLTEATDTSDAFAEAEMSMESDVSDTDEDVSTEEKDEADATVDSASAETPTEDTDDALETDDGEVSDIDDDTVGEPSDPTDIPAESDEETGDEFGEAGDDLSDEEFGETGGGLSDEGLGDELSDEEFGEAGDDLSDKGLGDIEEPISDQHDPDTDDDGAQFDEIADTQSEPDSTLSPPEKPVFEPADEPRSQIPTPSVDLPESDDEDADALEAMEESASREHRDADRPTDADEVELTEFDAVTGTATDGIELDQLVEFDAATEDERAVESDDATSQSAESVPEATAGEESHDSSITQSSERDWTVSLPRTIGGISPTIDWTAHTNLPVTQAEVTSDDRDEETIPRFESAEQRYTRRPRTVPQFEPADRHPDRGPLCLPRFEPDTNPLVRDKRAIPRFEPSPRGSAVFPHFAPAVGIQDRTGLTLPRFDAIGKQSRSDARVLPQFVATGERPDDDRFVYPQFQHGVGTQPRIEPVRPQFADIGTSRMRDSLVRPEFGSTPETTLRDQKTLPRFRPASESRNSTDQVTPQFNATDRNSRSDASVVPRFRSATVQSTHDQIVPTFEPATTELSRDGWVLPRIEPATDDRNVDLRISPRFEPEDQPSVADTLPPRSDESSTAEPEEQTKRARSEREGSADRSPDDGVADSRRTLEERAAETDGMVLFDETDEPTLTATDTTDDEHEYAQMAEEFVAIWDEYALDYTPESLGSLDDLVDSEWKADRFEDATYGSDETYDDHAFTGVVTELGSYFGEVLIRELDGEWSDETGTDAVIIDSPDERLAVPVFRIATTSFRQQPVFTRSYEALRDDLGLSD
jgi:hypothetical protein